MSQQKQTERRAGKLEPGGLWIPPEISRIPRERLCWLGKMIAGRIYRYRVKGCYESKPTIAKAFGVSLSPVIQAVRQLKAVRVITFITAKGRPDCMWLRCDPKVQAEEWLYYRGKKRKNPAYTPVENDRGGVSKTIGVPLSKTTPNNKKIIRTTGAASPLLAVEQARRLQEDEDKRLAVLDTAIRAEFRKRMKPVRQGDWLERKRRADVFMELTEPVKELMTGGLGIVEAVDRVFEENRELITGGKKQ